MLMLTAREASTLLTNMPKEERLAALEKKVSEKTKKAIDKKIREMVAAYERSIEFVLNAKVCIDKDDDIEALLKTM